MDRLTCGWFLFCKGREKEGGQKIIHSFSQTRSSLLQIKSNKITLTFASAYDPGPLLKINLSGSIQRSLGKAGLPFVRREFLAECAHGQLQPFGGEQTKVSNQVWNQVSAKNAIQKSHLLVFCTLSLAFVELRERRNDGRLIVSALHSVTENR